MAAGSSSAFSVYPNGFPNGLVVRGLPMFQTQPGNVYWVSNTTTLERGEVAGSDGNPGTYQRPFATLQYALNQCTANKGDVVIIKPGYTQTVSNATGLLFNKAGVAIIGLGAGSNRPTFTFSTATTANIPVTAANMSIQNCLFIANFADIVSVFTATGTATPTDFSIENCEFRDKSSILDFLAIVTGNATANSLDGFRFASNKISSLTTTAGRGSISIGSDTFRLYVEDNRAVYAVLNDTACFIQAGTTQLTSFFLARNIAEVPNTSSTGGSFVSGSGNAWTGMAYDNYFYQVDGTAGIWIATGHGTAFGYQNNYSPITGAADKSGLINPAAA